MTQLEQKIKYLLDGVSSRLNERELTTKEYFELTYGLMKEQGMIEESFDDSVYELGNMNAKISEKTRAFEGGAASRWTEKILQFNCR